MRTDAAMTRSIALMTAGLLAGCAASTPSEPTPPTALPTAALGVAITQDGRTDAAMALYELTLDPATLETSLSLTETRSGQQNDDLYWLDVGRFFGANDLRILDVSRYNGTLNLQWEVRHPFAPPTNPAGPASAKNRADLGIAGQLVYLIDVPNTLDHRYFDDVIANAEVVANADAFVSPAAMIPTTLTANTFPTQVLVDERGTGSRVNVSNQGSVYGNYGSDGWTRAELGATLDQWTGYGVLHQGQASRRILSLDASVLERDGPITFGIAVLVRYNDPRNAANQDERIAHRLPPATADPSIFAYRMPHGALDCSETEVGQTGGPIIANDTNSAVNVDLYLVDWDARSLISTASDLSEEPDLTRVVDGAQGFPLADVSFPRLLGATIEPVLHDGDGSVGTPDDPLHYTVVLNNAIDMEQRAGIAAGLVRWQDPERNLTPALATPLDRDTLAPLTDDLPRPIFYAAIRVDILPAPSTWVREFEGPGSTTLLDAVALNPDTGQSWLVGSFDGQVDLDPGPGNFICSAVANRDLWIAVLSQEGVFEQGFCIGGPETITPTGIRRSANGDICIAGTFTGTVDFDPGPGTQNRDSGGFAPSFCLSLSSDGVFQWVDVFGDTGDAFVQSVVTDAAGRPYVYGSFYGPTDFDPGAGMDVRTSAGEKDLFIVGLQADGSYRWAATCGSIADDVFARADITAADQLLLPGTFVGTIDFDPGAGVAERSSIDDVGDAFLWELDANGTYQRVNTMGGIGGLTESSAAVLRRLDDGVVLTGQFTTAVDFDPGPGTQMRDGTAPGDWFVLALNADRSFDWVATIGSASSFEVSSNAIVTDLGEVRTLGSVIGGGQTVDFDPGPGVANFTNQGIRDMYLWGLDADGHYQWARQVGGLIAAVIPSGIQEAPDGTVRQYGVFNNVCDFDVDPDPDRTELHFANPADAFFVKYSPTGEWIPVGP